MWVEFVVGSHSFSFSLFIYLFIYYSLLFSSKVFLFHEEFKQQVHASDKLQHQQEE